ncbi:MAG TPA: hypothetical protein VHA35_22490 [Dongiaceae bacterium]|nr:hypothetical protein [Dongiaceae bacterium]
MADRRQIESMVKKKEQEIQELEEKVRETRVYLQALQDVLKKFPRATGGEPPAASTTLRPGSTVALARESILKAKRPLYVDDLLRDQGKELTRENRTALSGSLSAYVRKESIFTRTGPNTFGLLEIDDSDDSAEPPADFGKEPAPSSTDDDDIPF